MAKNSVYTYVFKVYGLTRKEGEKPNACKYRFELIRSFIKRQLSKYYPNRKWTDLSKYEQDVFVYLRIREKMLNKYIEDHNVRSRLRKKLDKYISDNLLIEADRVDKYNQNQADIYTNFFPANGSDRDKRNGYKKFSSAFIKSGIKIPIPTYEEWVAHPLRIYDYIKSFEEEENSKLFSGNYNDLPSIQEIDHIIISVILKILKEEFYYSIDINSIDESLYTIKVFEYINNKYNYDFESLQNEIDSNLDEEQNHLQKARIDFFRKYVECKRRIEDLDFIIQSE